MVKDVEKYLEDLEKRIDPDQEEKLFREWVAFADGTFDGELFVPERNRTTPPTVAWPDVGVNQAVNDKNKMLVQQLAICSRALEEANGDILCVRANYGTGILPCLFGAELFIMEEKMNTLPTVNPLIGGRTTFENLLEEGVPDLRQSLGGKTLDMGEYFIEVIVDYPNIKKYVYVYHPDLQGPIDICELLWGWDLFLAVSERPELVKSLLELITETYIHFMKEWNKIMPATDGFAVHWSMLHKGHIMLRDDSAMNFSPEMFAEFIRPYDQKLLNEFGGGAIHFCGKGDHFMPLIAEMDHVFAVNMSQPELNGLETIFQNTVDKGIKLIGMPVDVGREAVAGGRNLRGNVHCRSSQGGLGR